LSSQRHPARLISIAVPAFRLNPLHNCTCLPCSVWDRQAKLLNARIDVPTPLTIFEESYREVPYVKSFETPGIDSGG
ncbi:MAG: hypothetical protein ACXVJ8_17560, partial [Candidatus Angelobacter sp.]